MSLVLVHSLAWQKKNVCDGRVGAHVCGVSVCVYVCLCRVHAEVRGRHRVPCFITPHIIPLRADLEVDLRFRGKEMGSKSQ